MLSNEPSPLSLETFMNFKTWISKEYFEFSLIYKFWKSDNNDQNVKVTVSIISSDMSNSQWYPLNFCADNNEVDTLICIDEYWVQGHSRLHGNFLLYK